MIASIAEYIITISYASLVGIVFMLIYLFMNSKMDLEIRKVFFAFLIIELAEMIAYDWELVTARWESATFLRVLLSVIGYSLRPMLVYLILMLAMRLPFRSRKTVLYAVPLGVNILISCTAFWSGIAFSYTEDNQFVRGPLGFSSQCVMFLYIFWLLIITFTDVYTRSKMEMVIVFAAAFLCVSATVVETAFGIRSFGRTSIMMSVIFYFMYFQSNNYEQKMEESALVNRELKKVVQIDTLTELLNKRAFMEVMEDILKNSPMTNHVVFFFDLDNFKGYNDTFGHLAGDELLKMTAGKVRSVFRSSDVIGRFGGDEFYIFMNDVPYESVIARAEQLLRELRFKSDNHRLDVTASIGIVYQTKQKGFSCEELLKLADTALYDAKKKGKNCYIINTL